MAALAVISVALAYDTVFFYPPMGLWLSWGHPSGSSVCGFSWDHRIETFTNRREDGPLSLYVAYYDLYEGNASVGGLYWSNHWLVDGWDPNNSKYTSAPLFTPFEYEWYVSIGRWFNSDVGYRPYGETRFRFPWSYVCQGTSIGVYGP